VKLISSSNACRAKLAEPPRFQGRVRQVPDPYRKIEAVPDHVDGPVRDLEIGLDPGIAGDEVGDRRYDIGRPEQNRSGNPEQA